VAFRSGRGNLHITLLHAAFVPVERQDYVHRHNPPRGLSGIHAADSNASHDTLTGKIPVIASNPPDFAQARGKGESSQLIGLRPTLSVTSRHRLGVPNCLGDSRK